MKNFEKLDKLLRQAMSSNIEPDDSLNQQIISKIRGKNRMKRVNKKRISTVAMVAIFIMATSITAFAAWHLLTPKQVAENLEDKSLAIAFEGEDAVTINQTQISGDYKITLLGIVSGKKISDFESSVEGSVHFDRTYAVVAIAKADGTPMPDTSDPEYDKVSFFVSPFIKGQDPKKVNIITMNGGYSCFVKGGIMYRIVECDDIEIFADRGLYLGVTSSTFYDVKAYNFNSKTGEITRNADYEGVNILFDLPLDQRKGDYEKAEKYLQELIAKDAPKKEPVDKEPIAVEVLLEGATIIPESVQEVVPDKQGMVTYGFDGHETKTPLEVLFEKDQQIGFSDIFYLNDQIINGKPTKNIIVFSRDSDGIIKGMMYRKK